MDEYYMYSPNSWGIYSNSVNLKDDESQHNYYDQNSFLNEKVENENIGKFRLNDPPLENDNMINNNIPFEEKSTGFNSKIIKLQEKTNEIKKDAKNEENFDIQLKKKKRKNFTENKTKRDDIKNLNRGRKKKDDDEIGKHTKYSEDNIILKIKVYIINSAKDLLNASFIYYYIDHKSFLKLSLEKSKYKSVKKDFNVGLLKTKLKTIFFNDISTKYKKNADINNNKLLIEKIYEEKKETDIIKILELTFEELLNIFRRTISSELQEKINHIKNFDKNFRYLTDLIEEENIKGESEDYTNQIKYLTNCFENWFNDKKARRNKNDNKK